MAPPWQPDPEKKQNRGYLGEYNEALSTRDRQARDQLRYQLDLNSWNFRIWGVAASGFLTDSYNLFATNVILATISFVYFPHERWCGLIINFFTLLGSVLGQVLFGYLADRYGRTRLYGIELVLVIVSTIGVATTSTGYGDISFLALFTFWRFVMGIGIGAEYPLSAIITSEWSSTSSRATMLSSVFLMQPVGQALAQLVGLFVLLGENRAHKLDELRCGLDSLHEEECKRHIDGIWRIVIGSGAVPALLAIIFRFFLYDCGLYTLEVKNKPGNAFRDTQRIYGAPTSAQNNINGNGGFQPTSPNGNGHYNGLPEPAFPVQFERWNMYDFLIKDKNWYYLLGTSMAWFFLDVSFYGFSLDNRGTLSDLWATTGKVEIGPELWCYNLTGAANDTSNVPRWAVEGLPAWQTDATQPCNTIYQTLIQQTKQYLLTVSLASIAGSVAFIFFVNRLPRRQFLTASFLVLTVLFLITGAVYYGVAHTPGSPATVVCVAVCHFMFNFGANSLTFIIPAEIFPTCYRCTCHGISAAAGKLGSILAILIVYGINSGYDSNMRQGLIFLLFAVFMIFGAVCSWAWLPDVQRKVTVVVNDDDDGSYDDDNNNNDGVRGRGREREGKRKTVYENKSLEELGEGYTKAVAEGQVFGVRAKWPDLRKRVGDMIRSRGKKKGETEGQDNRNGNLDGSAMAELGARVGGGIR